MSVLHVLTALAAATGQPARASGPERWKSRCPAHEDHSPSLSITVGRNGRVLLHCFAGCETAVILDRVHLTWGDLSA